MGPVVPTSPSGWCVYGSSTVAGCWGQVADRCTAPPVWGTWGWKSGTPVWRLGPAGREWVSQDEAAHWSTAENPEKP